jgi:hypothetical protein
MSEGATPDPAQIPALTPQPLASAPVPGDLSTNNLPASQKAVIDLGLEEQSHRLNLQRTVASSALAFSVVLFIVAAALAIVLLSALAGGERKDLDWHASILVAAFVVPPTVMVVALVRSVYAPKKDDLDSGPALEFIKEVVTIIASAFKRGGH